MSTIHHQIRIRAPKEKVWNLIADIGSIQNFNPNVSRSYYTSDIRFAVGASRHCDLLPMGSVEERVTAYEEGKSLTIEIYDGEKAPPFAFNAGRFDVRADGEVTVVDIRFEYRLKYGPIGWLLDRLVVNKQMSKGLNNILIGLKHHAETGELVDRQVFKQIRQGLALA